MCVPMLIFTHIPDCSIFKQRLFLAENLDKKLCSSSAAVPQHNTIMLVYRHNCNGTQSGITVTHLSIDNLETLSLLTLQTLYST